MQKSLLFALCLAGTALLASCGNTVPTESDSSANYPSTPPAFTGLPANRPHTKVLTQFAANAVQSFGTDGRIVFDTKRSRPTRAAGELHRAKTDSPDAQAVGTILVSPPTAEAPYGFLRRITKVTTAPDGSAVIETTEASLQEAIAGADIKPEEVTKSSIQVPIEVTLARTPKDTTNTQSLPELLPQTNFADSGVKPRFDIPIAENPASTCQSNTTSIAGGTLNRRGCITFKMWATVDVDLGWWWIFPYLQGFGSRLNGYAGADLSANFATSLNANIANISLPGNFNYTLVSANPGVVTFFVGPIPVVIAPQISLGVSFGDGRLTVNGGINTTINSSIPSFNFALGSSSDPVKLGFYCGNTISNGNWGCTGINNVDEKFNALKSQLAAWNPFSNPLSISTSASLNLEASYKGKLSLQAGVYLYGALGVGVSVEPYVVPRLGMSVSFPGGSLATPRTQVYGGIDGGVDGNITLGAHLLFINFDQVIGSGQIVPYQSLVPIVQSCWNAGVRC